MVISGPQRDACIGESDQHSAWFYVWLLKHELSMR